MIYTPRKYQGFTTARIVEHPAAGALVDMGLGKTVATLTAIDQLIHDRMEVSRVLVIAPKKVVESVWLQEAEKWDHLRHLRIIRITGDMSVNKRIEALNTTADIYLINCENTVWLIGHYAGKKWPFDMLVLDESSKFKNHDSKRFKALKRILPAIPRRVILTGTPMPQSYLDLWSQMFVLDQGQRLGKNITEYRSRYFVKNEYTHKWDLLQNNDKDSEVTGKDYYGRKILDSVSDLCFSLKTEDYLELPERIDAIQWVTLAPSVMKRYREFEREQILQLEGVELTAFNAGALAMKLTQFANGAVYYGDSKEYTVVHDEKIDAITETVESLNGAPVLIFYQFQHDLVRLLQALKDYGPRVLKTDADVQAWNRKEIQVMIAHPASAGHGLNLQHGGNRLEWFGVPRSSEQYMQGYKRVHRSGQDQIVTNNRILAKGTVDEAALKSLDGKISLQDAMLEFVKVKRDEYTHRFSIG